MAGSSRSAASLLKFIILLAAIGSAVYFFRLTEIGRSITPNSVLERIRSYQPYDRVVYVLLYILGTVVLLPGTALSFAGAVLFGTLEGTLWTWVGATIGATLSFLIAKVLGRDFVDRLLGGRFEAFDRRIRENGFRALLYIRLLPLFPFNGVNFGSGLTSIRLRDYVLATAIGIIPGTFMYQYLFATVGTKIVEEGLKLEYLKDPYLWAPIGAFVVFVLVLNRLGSSAARAGELSPPNSVSN